jgi:hypothetical protein
MSRSAIGRCGGFTSIERTLQRQGQHFFSISILDRRYKYCSDMDHSGHFHMLLPKRVHQQALVNCGVKKPCRSPDQPRNLSRVYEMRHRNFRGDVIGIQNADLPCLLTQDFP